MNKIFTPTAFLFLLAIMFSNTGFAQHGQCGTHDLHLIKERMMKNRIEMRDYVYQRGNITYVPLKLHLVAKNDGTGRANPSDVLEMVCVLNRVFADQSIQFYIKGGFRNLNQSAIYLSPNTTGGVQQIQFNKVNNAVNIFITGSTGTSGTLAYYQGGANFDYIVAHRAHLIGESVVPHEMGHFFSLSHPFYGWEGHAYDPNEHGVSVGTYAPSDQSEIGNVGLIFNEKQDRSNCMDASDGICDTPPDYLFAFSSGQTDCNEYTGGAQDPNGTVVDPIENNIMSYFSDCDSYGFTPDQKDVIKADLFSVFRNYIRPNYTPDLTPINSTATLTGPINGDQIDDYTSVTLEWEPVQGALSYVVEIDRLSNFGFVVQRFVVDGATFKFLDNLDADRTYYWRVRPYGEMATCTEFSTIANFKTGTGAVATKDIEYVKGWMVRPNPLRSGQALNIAVDADQNFDADVQLYDLTGKLIHQVNGHRFTAGQTVMEMPVRGLDAGMYIVAIRTEDAVSNRKVVVAE